MGRAEPIGFVLGHKVSEVVVILDRIANVTLIAGLLMIVWFAADRAPPFELLSVKPAIGAPGRYVTIYSKVKPSTNRQCASKFNTFILDSAGVRYSVNSSIVELTPDVLAVTVKLPININPGDAMLIKPTKYRCNITHRIVPIEVIVQLPFTVLQ